jgi:hypothetical protein
MDTQSPVATVETSEAKEIPVQDSRAESSEKKMREIIIETDGNNIHLRKADVSGRIELVAVLQNLIAFLNK